MGKHCADTETRFITLGDTEFMVWQLTWGEGELSYNTYDVFQPAQSFSDGFSSYTHSDDGRFWGATHTYFAEEKFAHLKPYTDERWKNARIYQQFTDNVAREIARLAFDIQGEVRF